MHSVFGMVFVYGFIVSRRVPLYAKAETRISSAAPKRIKGFEILTFTKIHNYNKIKQMPKELDIANVLSTPKELCNTCIDWCDGDFNDIPHCVNSKFYETHDYLFGETNTCPCYFEI